MTSINIPLYISSVPSIPSSFSHLLARYSNIPSDQQQAHIQRNRDLAYEHHKYPCLGRFRFLDLDMSAHVIYPQVVALFQHFIRDGTEERGVFEGDERCMEKGPIFLDLGCCIGQDLRKILLDCSPGLPPPASLTSKVFGADLLPGFIDAGYALFDDSAIIPRSQFITPADVFDTFEGNALSRLDGRVTVLHTGAFFHLFDLEQQRTVARRCLRLLSRAGVDEGFSSEEDEQEEGIEGNWKTTALIFGEQVGNVTAGPTTRNNGGMRYRHNTESLREMWEGIVGEKEWKGVVKGVAIESRMELRSQASKERDSISDGKAKGKVAELEAGSEEEWKKFVGRIEDGFRWQVWWVWVAFV